MPCVKYSEGLLSDYTDGALPALQTVRIRRHLRRCPDCARDVAALNALSRDARQLYADAASAPPLPGRSRRVVLRPLLAAGAVAAVAAGIWFTPEMPGRPRVAFADVENAMRQVKTASWQTTSVTYDRRGKPVSRDVMTLWARHDPATLAFRQRTEPPSRTGKISEAVVLRTSDKMIRRDGFGDWYVIRGKDAKLKTFIRRELTIPFNRPGEDHTARWMQQHERVGAAQKDQVHFRRVSGVRGATGYKMIEDVWADARTFRIVRRAISHRQYERRKDGMFTTDQHQVSISDNFRYNEPLPREMLSLTPPPGAKVYRKM